MTINELTHWRDANCLPDTWYLEINEQGLGRAMTLAGVRTLAGGAWVENSRALIRVVHTSMAGRDSQWITLTRVSEHPNVCPACGFDCEAMVGTFPGKGLEAHDWMFIPFLILMAIWTGVTTGAIYGWLILAFSSMPIIGLFLRETCAIWYCHFCHLVRSRQK